MLLAAFVFILEDVDVTDGLVDRDHAMVFNEGYHGFWSVGAVIVWLGLTFVVVSKIIIFYKIKGIDKILASKSKSFRNKTYYKINANHLFIVKK